MELSILRNYQQTPNKIIKNQDESKNRSDIFYSLEFIHFYWVIDTYIYIYIDR